MRADLALVTIGPNGITGYGIPGIGGAILVLVIVLTWITACQPYVF